MVQATSGDGGKGSERRPCLVDKRAADRNYLRVFGVMCEDCKGTGVLPTLPGIRTRYECNNCDGLGYVPKDKPKRIKKDEITE